MRLHVFLATVLIMTGLAMLYVHQRIVTIQLSYRYQQNHRELTRLLDESKVLSYTVSSLKSPAYLQERLAARGVNWVMPSSQQVVKVTVPHQVTPAEPPAGGSRPNRLLELFVPSAEAEE